MNEMVQTHREKINLLFFSTYIFIVNYMQIFAHHEVTSFYWIFWAMNGVLFYFFIKKNKMTQIRKEDLMHMNNLEKMFWLFILFIDLSKLVNYESNFFMITFILFGHLLPKYLNKNARESIIYPNLIGIFPFFLHTLYSYYNYTGYYNNSMGILLTINSYFLMLLLFTQLQDENKKSAIFLFIYLLLNMNMTYFTGSRTALLATIAMIACFLFYLVKTFEIKRKTLFYPIILGILYLSRYRLLNVLTTLLIKWEGNGLDFTFTGRTNIWGYTLRNYEFFGSGKDFFIENLDVFHGHNVLFNMLGYYGVIPFILLICIILYGLYLFIKVDRLDYRLFFILFITIGTFEGAIGGPEYSYFQLLFFLHVGFLIKGLNSQETLGLSQGKIKSSHTESNIH